MIITEDDDAAAMIRALRNQGRAPGDTWLQHTLLGYNSRLDELSAALGLIQMNRLDEMMAKRAKTGPIISKTATAERMTGVMVSAYCG